MNAVSRLSCIARYRPICTFSVTARMQHRRSFSNRINRENFSPRLFSIIPRRVQSPLPDVCFRVKFESMHRMRRPHRPVAYLQRIRLIRTIDKFSLSRYSSYRSISNDGNRTLFIFLFFSSSFSFFFSSSFRDVEMMARRASERDKKRGNRPVRSSVPVRVSPTICVCLCVNVLIMTSLIKRP